MKKIVFCNIPFKKEVLKLKYHTTNKLFKSDKEFVYPINAALANILKEGDDVKIVLMGKNIQDGCVEANIKIFKEEFDSLNIKNINVEYVELLSDFEETKSANDNLLKQLINQVEEESTIYTDITYGPKSLPIIMFSVLKFVDKFADATIENIIYGKVEFAQGCVRNPEIYDMMDLFYLNSITDKMSNSSFDSAKRSLEILLDI